MNIQSSYKIGYLLKPHGLKGEITMSLDEVAPMDMDVLECIFIEQNHQLIPYFIEAISTTGSKAYVKLEDVNTLEEAQRICKSSVYLPKAQRAKSARGEFYDDEIIGFEATDETFGRLGLVTEIIQAGMNKLISVNRDGKEVLIPVNSPFIKSINKSKKTISLDLPEGFLDI